jgi:hypothetical protein
MTVQKHLELLGCGLQKIAQRIAPTSLASSVDILEKRTDFQQGRHPTVTSQAGFCTSKARGAPDLVHNIDVVIHTERPAVVPPALLRAPLGQRAQRLGDHRLKGRDLERFHLARGRHFLVSAVVG